MQGHRSAIGSLPETLDFDHGSSSSNPTIDQQLCWSNVGNPGEHGLPDYILPPGDTGITYINSVGHEGQNLSRWNLGEPGSGNRQNEASHDERKTEQGWSSSLSSSAGLGPRLEDRQHESNSIFSRNNDNVNISANQMRNGPYFMQSSSADVNPQSLNLNAGFLGHSGDDYQVLHCPNSYKASGSVNEGIASASSSSNLFASPSGSGGFLVEENDGRQGSSLEGRRLSCKRKALEGAVGQSSLSGSSRCFQRAESSGWQAVPSRANAGTSLRISSPSDNNTFSASHSEQVNPRLGLGPRGVASGGHSDSSMAGASNSQRNFRVRHSSRILPHQHSLNLRSAPPEDNTNPQSQPAVIQVPALPQNIQSVRWNGSSSSRLGNSSSSAIPGERNAMQHAEGSLRNMPRHIMEHPLFVPATELRNLAQHPTSRTLTGGSISIPGNGASTSRPGSSSGVHPSSAPTWIPHRNPSSQYPRRLSEYVRRSLLSSVGSDSGGLNGNHSLHTGASASSHDAGLPAGTDIQGNHHHTYPRSALWLERQGDGVLGVPYSLRTLATASEGRSRLVSEIRNVLDLMRRGEALQLEDVMILDQSMLFGVADVHDRHRDLRLDVDNMSYEELLALGERIGDVSTGLSEETILKRLKQRKYASFAKEAQLEAEPCCVCQEEYNDGDDLAKLECGHDFHTGCIKQWLTVKNICPICKTTALVT